MTKAEFLHLSDGTQRWILYSILVAGLSALIGTISGFHTSSHGPDATKNALATLRLTGDLAAQEEVTVDQD